MSMRCVLLRPHGASTVVPTDDWGAQEDDPTPDEVDTSVPCFAWAAKDNAERLGEASALFGVVRMIVPADVVVETGDRVDEITDRLGAVVFSGPLRVVGVARKPRHTAVMLRVQDEGQV